MKKMKSKWKRFLLWIGAAGMLLVAAGCAPPKETAGPAVQLDIQKLFDAAARDTRGRTVAGQVAAPEACRMEIDANEGALTVMVDASVHIPPCARMPVYRVRGADFTQEQLDTMYGRLRQNTSLPSAPPLISYETRTDGQTGQARFQTPRADAVSEDAYFGVINRSTLTEYIVPDTGETFLPGCNAEMCFTAYHEYCNFGQHAAERILDESVIPPAAAGNLTATPAQAREEATRLLRGFDVTVTDIFLTDNEQFGWIDGIVSEASEYAYILLCARNVEGAPCASSRRFFSTTYGENGESLGAWSYEWIEILYTRDGICQFSWFSPIAVTDVVLPETKLLPFSEIMDVFSKMILAVNPLLHAQGALRDKGLYDAGNVVIDKIVLSYQRICGTERYDEGFLIPAWSFYGREYYDLNMESDELVEAGNVPPDALLIINAIDGSVINLAKGY